MPTPIDRPGLLLSGPMTDYCLGIERKSEWIALGPHYAPTFLVGQERKVTCHVYAVPIAEQPLPSGEPDKFVTLLNENYFNTQSWGRCDLGRFIFSVEKLDNLELPVLRAWLPRDFHRALRGLAGPLPGMGLSEYWWASPWKRRYERIVVVPRGSRDE
jgi:hypothetical protein